MRELGLVRLVLARDVAAGRLRVPADLLARGTVVEDGLQVPATVDATVELCTRVPAHIDLASADGDHARAVRADVVVLVARTAQLLERRHAVAHRRAPTARLPDGLGLIRSWARCGALDQ